MELRGKRRGEVRRGKEEWRVEEGTGREERKRDCLTNYILQF